MKVYVCLELNSACLAEDAGEMNELTVIGTPEAACDWFVERVEDGKGNDFVLDEEDDLTEPEQIVNRDLLLEKIKEGSAELTMFRDYQENWKDNYSIIVIAKEVE